MIVVKNPQKLKEDLIYSVGTITEASRKLKYSKAYISSLVTGVRNPNPDVAVGICELTGKTFDTYFFIQSVHKRITQQIE